LQFCRPTAETGNISATLPGKAAGQGCRARLLGKAAGQGCRARLPGKAAIPPRHQKILNQLSEIMI
jgi:hypothetical protein